MLRALKRTAEGIAEDASSRYDPESAYGRARLTSGPLAGAKESPQQMEQRAAMLAALDRQKAAPGGSPAQKLALQALVARASEGYTHGRGAQDLRVSNEKTRVRRNNGPLGGMLATGWTADNSAEHSRSTQAATMAGNKSLSGSMVPRGYSGGDDRPMDPRLTAQGRSEYGRIAEDASAAQAKMTQQTRMKAEGDRQALADRRRMATEGDAWAAEQQRQSQALLALGTRNARNGY